MSIHTDRAIVFIGYLVIWVIACMTNNLVGTIIGWVIGITCGPLGTVLGAAIGLAIDYFLFK